MLARVVVSLVAALGIGLWAGAQRADALSCVAPPTGPPTEAENVAASDAAFDGVALSGPNLRGYAFSPARFAVERYLKGSGPRVVLVATGAEDQLGDAVGLTGGEFSPHIGERARVMGQLPGRRSRVRPVDVIGTSHCYGTRSRRSALRTVVGSMRRATAPAGGSSWRAFVRRGRRGVRCLTAVRLDRPARRRACELLSGPRDAALAVEHSQEGSAVASTVVAATAPGLRQIEVAGPDGRQVAAATAPGRVAMVVVAGYVRASALPVTLRFAGSVTRSVQADAAVRVSSTDPGDVAPWTARPFDDSGARFPGGPYRRVPPRCVDFEQEHLRFAVAPEYFGGGGTCGRMRGDDLFYEVVPSAGTLPDRTRRERARTVLAGMAGPSVESVTVRGPSEPRQVPLARRGRAFLTVYPGTVTHGHLTVEVRYRNGTRAIYAGRRVVE